MFGRSGIKEIDISSRDYLFHWGQMAMVPLVLQKGIYSPSFAQRVKDSTYHRLRTFENEQSVFLKSSQYSPYADLDSVCYVVESKRDDIGGGTFTVRRRIKPRNIKALVVLDRNRAFVGTFRENDSLDEWHNHAEQMASKVVELCEQQGIILSIPIYGTSGEMYYPKRKTRRR